MRNQRYDRYNSYHRRPEAPAIRESMGFPLKSGTAFYNALHSDRIPRTTRCTMISTKLSRPFRGIVPPMVTPLLEPDRLDLPAIPRLVEHILSGGVHGLFILGTTGEAPGLSYRLRCELIERVCEQVSGRVPVLVGITDTSFTESVTLAEVAADHGADAVVLAAPYFFPAGQTELAEYLDHIASALPLPIFLYNMPSHTKVPFEPDTVARAMQHPNIIGLKDSGGQMTYFHKLLHLARKRPEFTLIVGPEELLAEAILLGGHGGVCGGANMFPRLYVDLYEAAARGDLPRTRELHNLVIDISVRIYSIGRYGSSYIKGLKCALSCLGLCGNVLAEPFQHFHSIERERIAVHLAEIREMAGMYWPIPVKV